MRQSGKVNQDEKSLDSGVAGNRALSGYQERRRGPKMNMSDVALGWRS